MINIAISLIYTAYSIIQSEIEDRQRKQADVTNLLKILHVLDACGKTLRGDESSLDSLAFALNRALDASDDDEEVMVVRRNMSESRKDKVKNLLNRPQKADKDGRAK